MKFSAARQLVLLLVVALVLRLAAGMIWQVRTGGHFAFGDSHTYWVLARTIALGQPYEYGSGEGRIVRTPGYPLLLAPIFSLAGEQPSLVWARMLSAVFGTLAVGGVWSLAIKLFDRRCAMLAAAIAALYPGAIATSVLVLTEAPFCVLMLGQLALWTAAWHARLHWHVGLLAGSAGLAAGAATLVRPSWLLFTPFAVIVGMAATGRRSRQLGIGVAMLTGLVLAMIPWWVRNAEITGHFVPTTLQVGASLYDGLSQGASGASDRNMEFVEQAAREERRRPAAAGGEASDIFEYRLDRRLRRGALDWARDHPRQVARLAGAKLLRMWNIWPNEPALSSWPIRSAVLLTYLPLVVLGIIGAARTIRWGWPYVLLWLPAVYFTLLHMVFVSSIRYRQPAMLGLIVLAAGVLASSTRRQGRQSPAEPASP